ncbi:MAG TPA: AMP-binding acetyl-CoA synthetase, partial [Desulfobacteraceae bacterium]|nr:AMP-binding acetyl-CoA synthetase [Desulfobacteraceae bacterium]
YKMPEKTEEEFTEDGFFKTGDLGEIDEKGRLKITGRAKEQFKTSKGKYVAPAPIENQLAVSQHVEACCVTGSGYPQPHAVVMLSEGAREAIDQGNKSVIEGDLADHLNSINRELPHHERLAFVVVAKDEWLPENGFLTPTMKLKRAKLEEVYGPHSDGWYEENRPVVWQG